jgi:hypothetical protein
MATFDINSDVGFNYNYSEEDDKQVVEGQFFSRSSNSSLGVSLKVACKTREEAVNAIHHYAKLISCDIGNTPPKHLTDK